MNQYLHVLWLVDEDPYPKGSVLLPLIDKIEIGLDADRPDPMNCQTATLQRTPGPSPRCPVHDASQCE